jgi:hypothetical protein
VNGSLLTPILLFFFFFFFMDYETQISKLIISWDNGKMEGAQIIWELRTISNGTYISSEFLPPQDLSVSGRDPYTSLKGVLTVAQVDAFKRLDDLVVMVDFLRAENRKLKEVIQQLIARRYVEGQGGGYEHI